MSSIEAILTAAQLRWTGHVTRMSSDRLPKAVFYGELSSGKRLRGGQRLRYKDVLKRHLKTTHIPVNTWEPIAHDRQKWRRAIHQGKTHIEEKLTKKYQHEHDRRHGLLGASIPTVNFPCCPTNQFSPPFPYCPVVHSLFQLLKVGGPFKGPLFAFADDKTTIAKTWVEPCH